MAPGTASTDVLGERVRVCDGRELQPWAAVLDSQSARSSGGGAAIGDDAGERGRGRQRYLLVDTNGLALRAVAALGLGAGPGPKW